MEEGRRAPHWDVVSYECAYDCVELDAELDVAVADVFGCCLCTTPSVKCCFESFHVPDEVVYDGGYVGVELGVISEGRCAYRYGWRV